MSPNARRRAEFYLKRTDLDRANNVRYVGWQAQATAKMQNLETRLSDLAKIGADDVAIQMIDEYTVGDAPLLTQPMADQFKAKYWEQRDFFQVRELIDAGDPDVLEKLNKKSDGQFTEYTHLTRDQRDQLKRYGQQKTIERENEVDDNVLASFRSGNPIYSTKTQLDEALEKKQITTKQYNKYSAWLEEYNTTIENNTLRAKNRQIEARAEVFEAELATGGKAEFKNFEELKDAYNSGIIDAKEFNRLKDVMSRYESAQASAAKAKKTEMQQDLAKQATETKERIMWDVYQTTFSSNSNIAVMQAKELRDEADSQIKDYGDLEAVHKFIDQRLNDVLNGKDEFATTEGKIVNDWIDKNYRDMKTWYGKKRSVPLYTGLHFDPDGPNNEKDSQEFQEARFYELKDKARELLRAGEKSGDVEKKLKELVDQMNDGAIEKIMSPEKQRAVHKTETPKDGETLLFIPRAGRYAMFDADKKFLRWADNQ
jgi:hypothetical protein